MEHVTFEGYAPHKVPLIVEVLTDNQNRTAPEIRVLFKKGQLGASGSNKFLFDHVGIVEAHHADANADIEAAAIEANAQNVEPLSHAENDDIPDGVTGARFTTERTDLHAVSQWLAQNGWTVVTSELGYLAKSNVSLGETERQEAGEFLQTLEDSTELMPDVAAVFSAARTSPRLSAVLKSSKRVLSSGVNDAAGRCASSSIRSRSMRRSF